MKGLGMTECLRFHNGRCTPTFKNPRDGEIIHQLDHLFVSEKSFAFSFDVHDWIGAAGQSVL